MKTLLVVHSSGRITRSITRHLSHRFAAAWAAAHPGGTVIHRDVGTEPPPTVTEAWIAGAFADPAELTPAQEEALRISNALIDELVRADAVVIGAPMYNFGLPAQLKAYFDQIVRAGRTFGFDPESTERYRPLLAPKPVAVMVSVGDAAFLRGGPLQHLNFLEPHVEGMLRFVGLTDVTFIRVGDEERPGESLKTAIAEAERAVDAYVAKRWAPIAA